ncbi:hypothetical protein BD626DRAFT_616350 [Schizophyllum amplum]|uniref:RING-type domain-containing protein n=1 Tax=Schizophyllum amplum TaxID=97359 RepID=A0A550CLB4_9AGAR|nr:hypothetical protein BD626DRAFT_616350 [Auriculariopsis ampla]
MIVRMPPAGDPPAKRRKLTNTDLVESCSAKPALTSSPGKRGKLTQAELLKRERRLAKLELDYQDRSEELERRYTSLNERETQANSALDSIAERDALTTLSQLEELFSCPICQQILTVPYSLNPSLCGHTFCGICILRWFFTRLHEACGGWHESVDCPICRQLLVITPDRTPRLEFTFPFVPNRSVANACETLIERLAQLVPSASAARVKREISEAPLKSRSSKDCDEKDGVAESTEDNMAIGTINTLEGWREGGPLRTEWLKKDSEGKKEMSDLISKWTTLKSADFVRIKRQLCT